MNWLLYTAASVLSDSSRIYIDNYISDYYYKGKGAAAQKYFYAVAFVVLAIILIASNSLSLSLRSSALHDADIRGFWPIHEYRGHTLLQSS